MGLTGLRYAYAVFFEQAFHTDWYAYYRAATEIRNGTDIYRLGLILVERNDFDYWNQTEAIYAYPPLLAFLWIPITWLGRDLAGGLWLAVITLATAGFLWVTLRILGRPAGLVSIAVVAVPALNSVLLLWAVRFGQIDGPLLLLTTLALLASVRGHDTLAGLTLGVAAAIKPHLALYGLFYLRKRRWTTIGAAVVSGAIFGFGSFAPLGVEAVAEWLTIIRYLASADFASYPHNHSLNGLLLRAFHGGPLHPPLFEAPPLAGLIWPAVTAGLLAFWWRLASTPLTGGDPSSRRRILLEYALLMVILLFVGPLSEGNHFVAVLFPLAIAADNVWWGNRGTRWSWRVILTVVATLYYVHQWIPFPYVDGETPLARLLGSGLYLYGLLPLGGALLLILRNEGRSSISRHQ